jgi:hypothetical protein
MKDKDRTSEREYQDRLESLLKNAFNAQLQPLRSLETATKKRRGAEKEGGKQFWVHEINDDEMTTSGIGTFETFRPALVTSAYKRRPEVVGTRSNRRD